MLSLKWKELGLWKQSSNIRRKTKRIWSIKFKKWYAIVEYEDTDTLCNIFEEIFANVNELEKFFKRYNK